MRIALVNASLRESSAYALPDGFAPGFENVIRPYQPLGLLSIAGMLLQSGNDEIVVIDPDMEGLTTQQVVARLKRFSPDIIGLSCMTFTYLYCLSLARDVKKELDSIIVIGGTHVSLYPQEVLSHDAFDIGIPGDGEYPFKEIAQCLSISPDRKDFLRRLHAVRGIVFRENGVVKQTPAREIFHSLDRLPFPAYHLINIRNYDQDYLTNPVATLITSRGCPMRCSFCSRSPWDCVDRYHSPRYVVELMEYLVENTGARSFYIVDDTFTYHTRRAIQICDLIRERGLDIQFSALTRVTHLNDTVIRAMKEVGLQCLSIGVESGDQFILNRLCKGQTLQQVKKAFDLCRQHDVDTITYFLVGHPDEEKEHVENTLKLIKEIRPEWLKANILMPYPGTSLYRELMSGGVIDDFWRRMTLEGKPYHAPNISRHLTLKELERYRSRINLMPYTRIRGNNLLKLTKIRSLKNAALSARWVVQCGQALMAAGIKRSSGLWDS